MTKIKTTYLGGLRTEAVHEQSGTKLITDAPLDNHGKGESFSPTDLVAAALGSCMLTIMGISAESYGFELNGTTLEIEKIMAANPRRIAEVKIVLNFPHGKSYTDQHKRIIESSAKTCPVFNSLGADVKKTLVFNY